jgi:DNA-binding NarL/FixJ family response regulator
MSLLERDSELAVIAEAAEAARHGRGSLIFVSGPAGVGKSAVLAAAVRHAADLRALAARGGELERDLPLGLARQLLEPAINGADPAADAIVGRGSDRDGDTSAILHGLHAAVCRLAAERPLLLAADDVQWADAPSLRFLAFLAHRIGEVPAVMLLARRSGEPASDEAALDAIAAQPHAQERVLAPLSLDATTQLITDLTGASPDELFCRACHEASAGNPFVLRELVQALRERAVSPDDAGAAHVREIGPPAVARWVLARLSRLQDSAAKLAHAVAILGQEADVGRAAQLAGLSLDATEVALDALVANHVLAPGRPLEFIHPVVRSAIHDAMAPGSRSSAHRRAARLLHEQQAAPGAVAMHLLAAEPAGEPWVAEALLEAANVALAQGAPDAAVTQAQRALDEPPPAPLRPALLRALGKAEQRLGLTTAGARFVAALDATADVRERAQTLLELLLMGVVPETDVIAQIRETLQALAPVDTELALILRARLLLALELSPELLRAELPEAKRALAAAPGNPLGARLLAGMLASHAGLHGQPRRVVQELALRAVGDDDTYAHDLAAGYPHTYALNALSFTDLGALSQRRRVAAAAHSERGGSLVGAGIARFMLALDRAYTGQLTEAAADARRALEFAARTSEQWLTVMAVFALVEVLVEQGKLDEALAALERHELTTGAGSVPPPYTVQLMLARSALWTALRRPAEGHAEAMAAGRMLEFAGIRSTMPPWRTRAALALIALGRHAEAQPLAEEALTIARAADVPSAIGEAVRVLALSAEGDVSLLHDAVAVLETAPAPVALARALTDLGAALRRAGERQAAREPLSRALELAHRHGAETARVELRAAGARPRRVMRSGVDALTPSERRIAELAAAGLTNAEIAAQLFITLKTVEHHLGAIYRKLQIASRRELASALQKG